MRLLVSDQSVYVRQPRGLSPTEIANAAVRQLLKGAKYIREQQGRSLYLKVGNYKDALRDFKSVKPANVKGHASKGGRSKTLTGTTGDRKLRVQTYDDSRLTKSRSDGMILVSSPLEGELPYKIVYTQKKL